MIRLPTRSDQTAFYLLAAVITLLTFWLIRPYLGIVAFSLMMVVVLKPLYNIILRRLRGRAGLATALTIMVFMIIVLVPLWIALQVIADQIQSIMASTRQDVSLAEITPRLNDYLSRISPFGIQITPEMQQRIQETALQVLTVISRAIINLGMSIPSLISSLFIFLGIVGALLPNYESFVVRLKRLSPLDDKVDALFLRKIKLTIWSMFIGIFVIAVAQGLVTGIFFWLAGVPYTPLWTLIAIVAAMFPLGASLVALPIGVVMLLMGNYAAGLIVLMGYLLVVSNVDTFIRPKLVPKEAYLSFALVLLGALGGYELFGFFGVVYGPVVIVLFLTILDVYQEYYSEKEPGVRPALSVSEGSQEAAEADSVETGDRRQETRDRRQETGDT